VPAVLDPELPAIGVGVGVIDVAAVAIDAAADVVADVVVAAVVVVGLR
jgi:hypothetical protein